MKMATAGTAIATGIIVITTTIVIATKPSLQHRVVSRAQQITAALFLFMLIPAFSSPLFLYSTAATSPGLKCFMNIGRNPTPASETPGRTQCSQMFLSPCSARQS
jgi:hypothetical protein